MPCSGIRKKTCVANDTECKWIVRKGCRRLVPITAAEKKAAKKKTKSVATSMSTSTSTPKRTKSTAVPSTSTSTSTSTNTSTSKILSAFGPSVKRSPKTRAPKPSPEDEQSKKATRTRSKSKSKTKTKTSATSTTSTTSATSKPSKPSKPSTKSKSPPRKFGLEWISADYLVVCTNYTSRIPTVMGSAEVMLNKYKSRTTRDAEIVAIRDSVAATWNTYGTTDATGKEIYRFLKKYKIDGCVVIKIKSKDGACKALGDYVELFKTDGKYKYCNMPCGPPSSLRLGNSEKLGRVMVAYYDAESD